MKALLVVLDGLGDRPIKAFGNKTPLEAANTPALDSLAAKGKTGLIEVIKGVAPESDAAILTLLGYDPHKYYTGRGTLEGVGAGVEFHDGNLALRCNFATSSDGRKLVDRRVARSLTSREAAELGKAINEGVKLTNATFSFKTSVAHRAVLVIKSGQKLSGKITNTDPAYEIRSGIPHALAKFDMVVQKARPLSKDAEQSASLVNEFTEKSYQMMKNHPVNAARRKKGLLEAKKIFKRGGGGKIFKHKTNFL